MVDERSQPHQPTEFDPALPRTARPSIGLTIPMRDLEPRASVALLEEAVQAGFTEVWSGEVNGLDAVPLLAAIATAIPDVQIGTGILSAFRWTPIGMAAAACALHDLSEGRFSLGIGSSSEGLARWAGVPFQRPARRVQDYVSLLRRVFAGEASSGSLPDGQAIRNLSIVPARPRPIPILVAAMGPRMLEFARNSADGLITNLINDRELTAVADRVRSEQAGRGFRLIFRVLVSADGADESVRQMERHLLTYCRVPAYRQSFLRQGYEDVVAYADRRGSGEGVGTRLEEMTRALVLFGAPEDIAARIRDLQAIGVNCVVLAPFSSSEDAGYRRDAYRNFVLEVARAWHKEVAVK